MKAVSYILRNATDVTDLLAAAPTTGLKKDSIYIGHGIQDQKSPYITIEKEVIDPLLVKEQGRSLTKERYEVFIYANDYTTAYNIAEKVEAALDNRTGIFNGQEITSMKLTEDMTDNDLVENVEYWLIAQIYEGLLTYDGVTYTPISAFTYSNNPQVAAGVITAMTPSVTGDVNNYKIADSDLANYNASGLTLNQSTGVITGTRTADASFEVIAVGKDGTLGSERVVVTETSQDKLTIQLTYATLAKTIWEATADAQGKGALGTIDAVPSVTFPVADINYTVTTPVAGIAVNASTGQVSVSNYASIPTAANSLVISWEVDPSDPNYTGSGTVEIVVTKEVRWLPESVGALETATLRTDASWRLYADEGDITELSGAVSAITNLAGTTWTQATGARQAQLTTMGNGRQVPGWTLPKVYSGSLASNFGTNFTVIFAGIVHKQNNSVGCILATSSTNRINVQGASLGLNIQVASGTSIPFTMTEAQWAKCNGKEVVVLLQYKTGAHRCLVYDADETIFSGTSALAEANDFLTTNLFLGARSSIANDPHSGTLNELITIEGNASATDESNLIAHMKYNAGLATLPPFV